jgi:hypothetical protein
LEVLALVERGHYRVDVENGVIFDKRGRPLNITGGGRGEKDYSYVRLYKGDGQRAIGVHALVWMVGNWRPLPEGFQVHHRDRDPSNNAFVNVFALSKPDHDKLHANADLITAGEEVPF